MATVCLSTAPSLYELPGRYVLQRFNVELSGQYYFQFDN